MFERYIIRPDSLRNVAAQGSVTGFAFDVRLAYYRGLALSMVEGFELMVDGVPCAPETIRFHVAGASFSFAELATEADARWEFNETASIVVHRPGGLPTGPHDIHIVEILRISYMPEPARRTDRKTLHAA